MAGRKVFGHLFTVQFTSNLLQYSSLCCTYEGVCLHELWCCTLTCLSTRACATPVRVCLQELLCFPWKCLHVYKSLCCIWTSALCRNWTVLSTRACASPVCVCLQSYCIAPGLVCLQESVLHLHVCFLCCTCKYLSTRACAAPGVVGSTNFFYIVWGLLCKVI